MVEFFRIVQDHGMVKRHSWVFIYRTWDQEGDDKYPVSLLHLATNWLVLLYDLNRYVTIGFRSPMCRPEYAGWTSIQGPQIVWTPVLVHGGQM